MSETVTPSQNTVIEVLLTLGRNTYKGSQGAPREIVGCEVRGAQRILHLAVDKSVIAADCPIDLMVAGQTSPLPWVAAFRKVPLGPPIANVFTLCLTPLFPPSGE